MSTRRRRVETPRGGKEPAADPTLKGVHTISSDAAPQTSGGSLVLPGLKTKQASFSDQDPRQAFSEIAAQSGNTFRVHLEFNEKPRQVTLGILLIVGVTYFGFSQSNKNPSASQGFQTSMSCLLFVIVVYCILNIKDGLMVRPHPACWRALHAFALWYFLVVTALLALPPNLGLELINLAFPEMAATEKKGERDAGAVISNDHLACEIGVETFIRQITLIWFPAHVIGWWAKMCMFRDWGICLLYSSFFEITELTLQFIIPQFQECWWDSLVIDWGLSNILGMYLGHVTLNWLQCRKYEWSHFSEVKGVKARATRIVQNLTGPYVWMQYDWNPERLPHMMVLNTLGWVMALLMEANSFLLIQAFALPSAHPFHVIRQVIGAMAALPAVAEWYEYVHGRSNRIGFNVWLINITVVLESIMALRYCKERGRFAAFVPPPGIYMPWLLFIGIYSLYFLFHCKFAYFDKLTAKEIPTWLTVIWWISFVPLLYLTRYWAY